MSEREQIVYWLKQEADKYINDADFIEPTNESGERLKIRTRAWGESLREAAREIRNGEYMEDTWNS